MYITIKNVRARARARRSSCVHARAHVALVLGLGGFIDEFEVIIQYNYNFTCTIKREEKK